MATIRSGGVTPAAYSESNYSQTPSLLSPAPGATSFFELNDSEHMSTAANTPVVQMPPVADGSTPSCETPQGSLRSPNNRHTVRLAYPSSVVGEGKTRATEQGAAAAPISSSDRMTSLSFDTQHAGQLIHDSLNTLVARHKEETHKLLECPQPAAPTARLSSVRSHSAMMSSRAGRSSCGPATFLRTRIVQPIRQRVTHCLPHALSMWLVPIPFAVLSLLLLLVGTFAETTSGGWSFVHLVLFIALLALVLVIEYVSAKWRAWELPNHVFAIVSAGAGSFIDGFPQVGFRGLVSSYACRLSAVLRDNEWRVLPRALMIRSDTVLSFHSLLSGGYDGCETSKLADVMELAMEQPFPVMMPPLGVVQPPPRHPSQRSLENLEGYDSDSDESVQDEDAMEPRSQSTRNSLPTVPEQMEYFVLRILYLLWGALFVVFLGVGVARVVVQGQNWVDQLIVETIFSLFPLLSFNAVLVQRIGNMLGNGMLSLTIDPRHDFRPRYGDHAAAGPPTFVAILKRAHELLHSPGAKRMLCFSRNPLHTLATVTSVAVLDSDGIFTDGVPVPSTVLIMRPIVEINRRNGDTDEGDRVGRRLGLDDDNTSSSDSSENQEIDGFLNEAAREASQRRQQRRNLEMQKERFHKEHFVKLEMVPSALDGQVVEFLDNKSQVQYAKSLKPLGLCCLLHALNTPAARGATGRSKPSHACPTKAAQVFADNTPQWSRGIYWLPKTLGFDDQVARSFIPLLRVHIFHPTQTTGAPLASTQACSIVATDLHGALHVFTMGSVPLILQWVDYFWEGSEMMRLGEQFHQELRNVSRQWERAKKVTSVACCHRILPERYRRPLLPHIKGTEGGQVRELFYLLRLNDKQPSQSPFTANPPTANGTSSTGQAERDHNRFEWRKCHSFDELGAAANEKRTNIDEDRPSTPRAAEKPSHRRTMSAGALPTSDKIIPDDDITEENVLAEMLRHGHTFLGFVGLEDTTLPRVEASVQELHNAGVRLVYFCPGNEEQSKAFGRRAGLETDWNCCISLRSDNVTLSQTDLRAQLPHGIQAIRKHLVFVDPIPLGVSMFSHAKAVPTRQMISILQDNHEVVCAVGSSLNHTNIRSFIQSDASIGVFPRVTSDVMRQAKPHLGFHSDYSGLYGEPAPTLSSLADLIGCVTAMSFPLNGDALPLLLRQIHDARLFVTSMAVCVEFIIQCNCSLTLLHFLALVTGLPSVFTPMQIIFLFVAVFPLLGASCSYSTDDVTVKEVMKVMPAKHNFQQRCKIFMHSTTLFSARFVPTTVLMFLVYYGSVITKHDQTWRTKQFSASRLALVRYMTLCAYVFLLGWHSACHISRHKRVRFLPLHNKDKFYVPLAYVRWLLMATGTLVLTILYCAASSLSDPAHPVDADGKLVLPYHASVIPAVLMWPVFIVAVDEVLKRWRVKRFLREQLYRRLNFGTKLGMHSPTGDLEYHSTDGSSSEDEPLEAAGTMNATSETVTRMRTTSFSQKLYYATMGYLSIDGGRLERNCVCCEHDR